VRAVADLPLTGSLTCEHGNLSAKPANLAAVLEGLHVLCVRLPICHWLAPSFAATAPE